MFIFQRTLQSVSPDTMGKIVRTYAALTVYMITYATGLQDNVNMGVNLDGQEADVINVRPKFYIYSIKSLINCFYSRQCGLSRGHCSNGCTPGWTGRRCSQIKLFTFLLNSRTSVLIKQKRATAVVQCSFCYYF